MITTMSESHRPLPAWRYVVRRTIAVVIIATTIWSLFAIATRLGLEPCDEPTPCGQMLPRTL